MDSKICESSFAPADNLRWAKKNNNNLFGLRNVAIFCTQEVGKVFQALHL